MQKAKTMVLFLVIVCFFNGLVFAQTKSSSSIFNLPGLKQVEAFRTEKLKMCQQKFQDYDQLVGDKNLNEIFDSTKKDLAYKATQQALPEDLRIDNPDFMVNYDAPKNFFSYHLNGLCVRFFESTLIYYGVLVLIILIIIKSFSK